MMDKPQFTIHDVGWLLRKAMDELQELDKKYFALVCKTLIGSPDDDTIKEIKIYQACKDKIEMEMQKFLDSYEFTIEQ